MAGKWDKVWAEMSGRVRAMWFQGCRPSVALLALSSLAHAREESISQGIKSGIKSSRKASRKSSIVAETKETAADASTPAQAGPEPKTPQEMGLAIAARRLLAARLAGSSVAK